VCDWFLLAGFTGATPRCPVWMDQQASVNRYHFFHILSTRTRDIVASKNTKKWRLCRIHHPFSFFRSFIWFSFPSISSFLISMRLPSFRLDLPFFCRGMPADKKCQIFPLKNLHWDDRLALSNENRSYIQAMHKNRTESSTLTGKSPINKVRKLFSDDHSSISSSSLATFSWISQLSDPHPCVHCIENRTIELPLHALSVIPP
jgi:hypothetical protein